MPSPAEPSKILFESLGISTAVEVLKSRDYFVVLPNEETIKNLEPDFSLMKQLNAGVIVTAKGHSADIVSRFFYPAAGIDEDPVTGSAHCSLIPYWSEKLGTTKIFAKQLSKRGGELWCEYKDDRVLMSGHCVLFLTGEISIEQG
jgi:predicted PhzF superfamily epimerase YddE/YHI9